MGIFANPEHSEEDESRYGVKIMFLHGLEGSPTGSKAVHLKKEWGAICPQMRTLGLIEKRTKCSGNWSLLSRDELDDGLKDPYQDALDALRWADPDIVVGSSMGGAILFKLIQEGKFKGPAVFCAPAIGSLLTPDQTKEGIENLEDTPSVWILAETDMFVSNKHNMESQREPTVLLFFLPTTTIG
jgi:hypothetical protein